jgi:hypothetical protein
MVVVVPNTLSGMVEMVSMSAAARVAARSMRVVFMVAPVVLEILVVVEKTMTGIGTCFLQRKTSEVQLGIYT